MGFIYAEFDTTAANFATDLRTKILTSSDYSNPTGTVVKATTPLGATIAVDLQGSAPGTQALSPYAYRQWTGGAGTGVDAYTGRQLFYKRNSSGSAAANPVHVRVAAGPTLLYVDVEGPRAQEANTDNASYGSLRQMFALAQLTPYFSSAIDPTPAVVLLGSPSFTGLSTPGLASQGGTWAHTSRDAGNVNSWVTGHLGALCFPSAIGNYGWHNPSTSLDGNDYLSPFVSFEDVAGMRGRLTDLFFAGVYGMQANNGIDTQRGYQPGDIATYNGNTYKILAPFKTDSGTNVGGSVGAIPNSAASNYAASPLVAVRIA